jgi:hypothetical protein
MHRYEIVKALRVEQAYAYDTGAHARYEALTIILAALTA